MKCLLHLPLCFFFALHFTGYVAAQERNKVYPSAYAISSTGLLGSVTTPENTVGAEASQGSTATMTPGTLGSATLVLKFLQLSAPLPVSVPLYVKLNTGVTTASMTFTVLSGTTTQNSTSEGTNLTTSVTTLPSNGPVKLTATTTGGVSTYNGVRLYTTATKEVITSFFYAQDVPLTFKAASITACGSYNLLDNLTHKFTNELSYEVFNDVGVKQVGTSIAQTGRYKIVAKDNAVPTAAAIESPFINVTINSLPVPSSFTSYYHLPINQAQSFPSITCSGGCTTVWRNSAGATVTSISAQTVPGIYTYTATISNSTCSVERSVVVEVYDPLNECARTKRTYATVSVDQSGTTNPGNASDADPLTSSLISAPISLLGLGSHQTVGWTKKIPIGTKVYVKLGIGSNLLGLISSLTVRAKNATSYVGATMSVSGELIGLAVGENDMIYSFTTTAEMDAVEVKVAGVLSLGLSANLYGVWVEEATTSLSDCPPNDEIDVLKGSEELLKGVLNAATATVGVDNPSWAIDGSLTTKATMRAAVGVAAQAKLDIIFHTMSQPGDSIFIKVQDLGVLTLLDGFSIQRYLKGAPVGAPIYMGGSVLSLLKVGTNSQIIFTTTTEPYDQISIRLGGVLNVLSTLEIYDIERRPFIKTVANVDKRVYVCEGDPVAVGVVSPCLVYDWYDSLSATTPLFSAGGVRDGSNPYHPTGTLGQRIFYIQQKVNGCVVGSRVPIKVYLMPKAGKPHLSISNVVN
ncbi:hypothetical protein [Sphingobacterium psychroaquaticum]|nr:hypothetical protein [Sphingobacterium psychroaquaticum]